MREALSAAGFPGAVSAAVQRSSLVSRLHYRSEARSTNDEAMSLARDGAPDGTLVLADCQTAGRGRHGRSWHSPAGLGLWMSFVLRPAIPQGRAFDTTAAAAVALVETAGRLAGAHARIRWPNDVLSGGRKLAGLLAEIGLAPGRLDFVVLGVGLNVNQDTGDFPSAIAAEATSLALLAGRPLDRALVLAGFLESFEAHYRKLLEDGGESVRREWMSSASLSGRRVRVETGDRTYEARAVGLAEDGALIVERDGGDREEIRAADVQLLREVV